MNFKYAYLTTGDLIYLSFVLNWEQTDYSDTYYTREYYFKMKVYVSDWRNHIMKYHQYIANAFESVFDKRPDENTFICDSVRVASGTCCFMDWDEANYKLQKFLDKYESEHPGVAFIRSNGGASIKFGDWK